MITKQEVVLLCAKGKAWEMKDKGTSGISYSALVYGDKVVTNCKVEKDLYERIEKMELVKGTAIIDIVETNYQGKQGVSYHLKEFGITK